MSVQPLRKEHDRNPRTVEEAEALVKHVESLFMPWNIDALVGGFTDDCVVRFGTVPEFRGRETLRAFFTSRSGKQRGYRLKKNFRWICATSQACPMRFLRRRLSRHSIATSTASFRLLKGMAGKFLSSWETVFLRS